MSDKGLESLQRILKDVKSMTAREYRYFLKVQDIKKENALLKQQIEKLNNKNTQFHKDFEQVLLNLSPPTRNCEGCLYFEQIDGLTGKCKHPLGENRNVRPNKKNGREFLRLPWCLNFGWRTEN